MRERFFTGYRPQFYFRSQPRSTTDIQAEIDATDDIREQLRQYARDTLDNGGIPSAGDFVTENTKPWQKYTDDFEDYAEKVIAEEVKRYGTFADEAIRRPTD